MQLTWKQVAPATALTLLAFGGLAATRWVPGDPRGNDIATTFTIRTSFLVHLPAESERKWGLAFSVVAPDNSMAAALAAPMMYCADYKQGGDSYVTCVVPVDDDRLWELLSSSHLKVPAMAPSVTFEFTAVPQAFSPDLDWARRLPQELVYDDVIAKASCLPNSTQSTALKCTAIFTTCATGSGSLLCAARLGDFSKQGDRVVGKTVTSGGATVLTDSRGFGVIFGLATTDSPTLAPVDHVCLPVESWSRSLYLNPVGRNGGFDANAATFLGVRYRVGLNAGGTQWLERGSEAVSDYPITILRREVVAYADLDGVTVGFSAKISDDHVVNMTRCADSQVGERVVYCECDSGSDCTGPASVAGMTRWVDFAPTGMAFRQRCSTRQPVRHCSYAADYFSLVAVTDNLGVSPRLEAIQAKHPYVPDVPSTLFLLRDDRAKRGFIFCETSASVCHAYTFSDGTAPTPGWSVFQRTPLDASTLSQHELKQLISVTNASFIWDSGKNCISSLIPMPGVDLPTAL